MKNVILKIEKKRNKLLFSLISTFLILFISPLLVQPEDNYTEKIDKKINDLKELKLKENIIKKDFYIIGPGDVLELKLFDEPDFSGKYKVLSDGTVVLPLIGPQFVSHLTLKEASNLIQKEYSNELLRPYLYLTIHETRPIRVSVIGAVESPGIYSLTNQERTKLQGGSEIVNSGFPTVMEAIQKAGGITQEANLKKVLLKRRLPGEEPKYKMASIDLLTLILNGLHSQNILLFDGDIIELTKAKDIPKELMEFAKANLSPKTITINVIGQVNNPGRLELMANTPLVQSIYNAGGPIEWKANKGNVDLVRVNRNGTVTKKRYKINLSEGVSSESNPPLMDQDIVIVNSSSLNKLTVGLKSLTEPVTPLVTALSLYKLLN
tara:strand:+ start:2288 stop:3424 length:1137 start_codon:yes stop_codon:yes gene_type:complete